MNKLPKLIYYFFILTFLLSGSLLIAKEKNDSIARYKEKIFKDKNLSIDSVLYYYDLLQKHLSIEEQAILLNKKASFLERKKMFRLAERTFFQALDFSKKNKIKNIEATTFHNLGVFYDNLNKSKKAYEYLLKARDLYEETENHEGYTTVITNIAIFLFEENKIDEAKKLLDKALNCYIKKKDSVGLSFVKINIANLLREQKKYEESDKVFFDLIKNYHLDDPDKSLVYYNLAINAIKRNRYTIAENYIDKSIAISTKINDEIQLVDLNYFKAEIEIYNNNYKNAVNLYDKSLITCEKIKDFSFMEKIIFQKITLALKAKEYDKIEILIKDYEHIHDLIDDYEKENTFKEVFLENQLDRKEREYTYQQELLTNEKIISARLITIIFLAILLIIALTILFIKNKKNNYKREQLLIQKTKIKELEIAKKREIEILNMKNLEREIEDKKKKLIIDIAFGEERKKNIEFVINKMVDLAEKSVISKSDIKNLINIAEKKYSETLKRESTRNEFVQLNKDFYERILNEHPQLSQTELRILSYIRLNIETKEIAHIQNVSVDAIRKTRYRIRKKMKLDSEQSLEKYILRYM